MTNQEQNRKDVTIRAVEVEVYAKIKAYAKRNGYTMAGALKAIANKLED